MMYSRMKFFTSETFLPAKSFISVTPEFGEDRILKSSLMSEVIFIGMPLSTNAAPVITSPITPSSSFACTATLRSFGEEKALIATCNPVSSKKPFSSARMIGIADSAGRMPMLSTSPETLFPAAVVASASDAFGAQPDSSNARLNASVNIIASLFFIPFLFLSIYLCFPSSFSSLSYDMPECFHIHHVGNHISFEQQWIARALVSAGLRCKC